MQKILKLQTLSRAVEQESAAWSTASEGCNTITSDEWSTWSEGCTRTKAQLSR